jgi:hypothetical protein
MVCLGQFRPSVCGSNTGIADMLPACRAHAKLKPKYSIKIANQKEKYYLGIFAYCFFSRKGTLSCT